MNIPSLQGHNESELQCLSPPYHKDGLDQPPDLQASSISVPKKIDKFVSCYLTQIELKRGAELLGNLQGDIFVKLSEWMLMGPYLPVNSLTVF